MKNSHTMVSPDNESKKNALKNTRTMNRKISSESATENEKINPIDNDDTSTNKIKHQLNTKFQKKIDKIIEYIDKKNFNFDGSGQNPKELLLQLKNDIDLNEKNNIIEQVESILKDYYNSNKGNSLINGSVISKK